MAAIRSRGSVNDTKSLRILNWIVKNEVDIP